MKKLEKKFGKILIFAIVAGSIFWAKTALYDKYVSNIGNANTRVTEKNTVTIEEELPRKSTKKSQEYVNIYFLYVKPDGENVFAKVFRVLPKNENKLDFAVKELLKGPNEQETLEKYYSEIPSATKALSVKETGNKVIINLSDDFQYGGGSDSLYSRVRQLLKTVMANTKSKNVYLYLNGKQADVIGGEGLMIKQPLKEDSLFDE